ncbi:MAG: TIGR02221 family CRISPR-associated protein [Promethearchaeia archaeon]
MSFLGTNPYTEVFYQYGEKISQNSYNFIQQALLEFFCKDNNFSEYIILTTELAKAKNWLNKEESDIANFPKGLRDLLNEQKTQFGINVDIRNVFIPEGKNENELWQIFDIIHKQIEEDDDIIFDITHSFRSLPLLMIIILNYVKFLKNVKINRILYGAFEVLGPSFEVKNIPLKDRIEPIFDLTPFVRLFDWTIAIERFLETGDAKLINTLGRYELREILSETKGKAASKLNRLINLINSFSKNVYTCRAPEFHKQVNYILSYIPSAEEEGEYLKPFAPLFSKLKEKFSALSSNNPILTGLEVCKWCLDNGLIQQSFTILREILVNFVLIKYVKEITIKNENDLKNLENRIKAEELLNEKNSLIPDDLKNLWRNMVDYRNDMNHAGWRENVHKPEDFKVKCNEFLEAAKKLILRGS